MRMRTKKWAKPELAVCPFYIKDSQQYKGKWDRFFVRRQPLYLELGCGKGGFLSTAASQNPGINYIGVDLSSDMLGLSKRKIEAAFYKAGRPIDNVAITWRNIEQITDILGDGDIVERIYINFCNPWFKPTQYKKRLTHSRQLKSYKTFLKPDGEIWLKTDDDELFSHSIRYFKEEGFAILFKTNDLHQNGFSENIVTEHEEMYTQQGIPIKFLIAQRV